MDDRARRLIEFVEGRLLERPDSPIDEDTPLFSAGLLDSFAMVEVLIELRKVTGRRIPAGRISPQDLDTVRGMLETAERVGEA
jgi:acyl carrier protein